MSAFYPHLSRWLNSKTPLSFTPYIQPICKNCWIYFQNISWVWPLRETSAVTTLVQITVIFPQNYCISLLNVCLLRPLLYYPDSTWKLGWYFYNVNSTISVTPIAQNMSKCSYLGLRPMYYSLILYLSHCFSHPILPTLPMSTEHTHQACSDLWVFPLCYFFYLLVEIFAWFSSAFSYMVKCSLSFSWLFALSLLPLNSFRLLDMVEFTFST